MGPDALEDRRYQGYRRKLIEVIRSRGVDDLEILQLFDRVPRHLFLPEGMAPRAYEDAPIPIGFGQTASQPSLQAYYLTILRPTPEEKVLEIGTGCGYQTAILAPLVKKIYTVERIPELQRKARQRLRELDIYNVQFRPGDGWEGWPKYGPYDGILVAAAAAELPEKLLEQLAPGGRLIMPVGPTGRQELLMITRQDDHFEQVSLGAVSFVPLVKGK